MSKSMVAGIAIGVAVATAGGAIAGYSILTESTPTHAEVVDVREVKETVTTPREVCQPVQVSRQKPVQDEHQVLGTVAGAVIGGVLGNQVGGGSGKKAATVAGAAAGGYAGNKTQERMQTNNTYQTTETQCETVMDQQQVLKGYQVTYSIDGEEDSVFMEQHPGSRIPLSDGELVLSR